MPAMVGKASRKRPLGEHPSNGPAKRQALVTKPSTTSEGVGPSQPGVTNYNTKSLKEWASRLRKERLALPIFQHAEAIRLSLRNGNILLLVGETGCGKSTQLPQILEQEPWCTHGTRIAVTQPRRVAATSLAARVAQEMGSPLGIKDKKSSVGYSVRFDKNYSPATRIKFLTEGTLLQEMAADPHLTEYSAVVVDEVHERSLNVDIILGHLREIVTGDLKGRKGQPLKVVVMSATLNVKKIECFLAEGFESCEPSAVGTLKRKDPDAKKELLNMRTASNLLESIQVNQQVGSALEDPKIGFTSETTESLPNSTYIHNKEKKGRTGLKSLVKNLPLEPPTEAKPIKNGDIASSANGKKTQSTTEPHFNSLEGRNDTSIDRQDHTPIATVMIRGRLHEVAVSFVEQEVEKSDRPEYALREIFKINYGEQYPGDILVFLPGQDEIESLEAKLLQLREQLGPSAYQLQPLPLFAQLPPDQQARVFLPAPPKTRKVILATNIAETSLTIPGIRYVVDTGLCKQKRFRPELGLDSLLTTEISCSSSMQRAGRAGREAPGKCFRIYTEESWKGKIRETEPEIRRCDLARALLGLVQSLGNMDRAVTFPYIDSPKSSIVHQAIFQISRNGALDTQGIISQDGIHMAHLPLSVSLSRVLLTAAKEEFDCLEETIDLIAGLSVERMFLEVKEEGQKEDVTSARNDISVRGSDHLTLMLSVRHYVDETSDRVEWCKKRFISHRSMRNATQVRRQLRMHFQERKLLSPSLRPSASTSSPELSSERKNRIMRCIMHGMTGNVARKLHDAYQTVETRQTANVHPSSVLSGYSIGLRPDMVIFHELVFTSKNYMRVVSTVEEEWYAEFSGE